MDIRGALVLELENAVLHVTVAGRNLLAGIIVLEGLAVEAGTWGERTEFVLLTGMDKKLEHSRPLSPDTNFLCRTRPYEKKCSAMRSTFPNERAFLKLKAPEKRFRFSKKKIQKKFFLLSKNLREIFCWFFAPTFWHVSGRFLCYLEKI